MPPTNGAKIRSIRREKGLKLGVVASEVGIRNNNLCNIENGHRNASLELLHRIARLLEVDVKQLLADDEACRDPAA
jgi:transcriptional regulator with XRE-family HTH domain